MADVRRRQARPVPTICRGAKPEGKSAEAASTQRRKGGVVEKEEKQGAPVTRPQAVSGTRKGRALRAGSRAMLVRPRERTGPRAC